MFLGVNNTVKTASFSDHTHNLTSLTGTLSVSNGGTGVSSLDDLKTALGIPNARFAVTSVSTGGSWRYVTVPEDWVCYIGIGELIAWGYKAYSTSKGSYCREMHFQSNYSDYISSNTTEYYSTKISINDNYTSYVITFYI